MIRERNHWDVLIAMVIALSLVLSVERMVSCVDHNGYPDMTKRETHSGR